jgi:DNA (cytosine-5)-methyltransferase 1
MGFDYIGGALDEIDVDNFAGGGGASTGIERATGRPITIAVNHSRAAIAMHAANHPHTHHECEDIWAVDPRTVCAGRRVRRAWFSPDCTHFSKAKGAQPRSREVRGLAGVVVKWAREVQPEEIFLENVEEFQDWGPLDENGKPDRSVRGADFRAWLAALVDCGYDVEYRVLVAANYGTPTTRKRLFLKAVRKGRPIVWPAGSHGKGHAQPWNTAASIIDWSLPCPSIFDRKRPLAEATLRRIAAGLRRYVIESARPFIVPLTHQGGDRVYSLDVPMRTVTCANRGELALVAPSLVQTGYGEREGQTPRALDIGKPLGTVVSGGKHALVSAFLSKHYTGVVGQQMGLPLGTVTTIDHHSLATVTLSPERDRRESVRAFLVAYYGSEREGQSLFDPIRTVPTKDRFGLVTIHGQDYAITDIGMRMLSPRELFNAQGFPADYIIDLECDGKRLTKTQQIELAGNSVCGQVAEALVSAGGRALAGAA